MPEIQQAIQGLDRQCTIIAGMAKNHGWPPGTKVSIVVSLPSQPGTWQVMGDHTDEHLTALFAPKAAT